MTAKPIEEMSREELESALRATQRLAALYDEYGSARFGIQWWPENAGYYLRHITQDEVDLIVDCPDLLELPTLDLEAKVGS